MIVLVLSLLPLLIFIGRAQTVIQTGMVTVNTVSFSQTVTVLHLQNSYCMISLSSITWDTDFSLITSYSLVAKNNNQDNLTISATITNSSTLIFSLGLQYVVLVKFQNYQIVSLNITSTNIPYSYTSTKNLVYVDNNGTISVNVFAFISGFSTPAVTDYLSFYGTNNSNVYDIDITSGINPGDWVTISMILMAYPMITECPNSKIMENLYTTDTWNISKNPNYSYVYGIQTINSNFTYGITYLNNNTFDIESGGMFSINVIVIDNECFKTVVYRQAAKLTAWQIGLIVAGSVVLFAVILTTIICCCRRRANLVQVDDHRSLKVESFEMTPQDQNNNFIINRQNNKSKQLTN